MLNLCYPLHKKYLDSYRYLLHWWVFVPYLTLRKVAEVTLFGDQDLQEDESLFISVCQWPKDLTKILVYGTSLSAGFESTMCGGAQTRRVFVTITAVPSLDNCSDCYQVATSYEEEGEEYQVIFCGC